MLACLVSARCFKRALSALFLLLHEIISFRRGAVSVARCASFFLLSAPADFNWLGSNCGPRNASYLRPSRDGRKSHFNSLRGWKKCPVTAVEKVSGIRRWQLSGTAAKRGTRKRDQTQSWFIQPDEQLRVRWNSNTVRVSVCSTNINVSSMIKKRLVYLIQKTSYGLESSILSLFPSLGKMRIIFVARQMAAATCLLNQWARPGLRPFFNLLFVLRLHKACRTFTLRLLGNKISVQKQKRAPTTLEV